MGGAGAQDRSAWTSRVIVSALLAVYVGILYTTTVLAGRAFVGASGGARFALTVLAAAVAALTLEPVGAWLRRRLPVPPQDRLARLARGAQAATDLTDVLRITSTLLQEGLGAASVEIRRGPAPVADHSSDVTVVPLERSRTTLGALLVTMPPGTQLSPRDRTLLAGVAQHLTTILQTAALREALRATVTEAELRTTDLRLSRQRIVLTAHEGRRQVERDIHDGAQQHLVALAVHLGLLRSLLADRSSGSPASVETARSADPVEIARSAARAALDALDELSSGLYPARLAEQGLAVALEHAARSSPLSVAVDARDLPRADPDVEAAVYFCCLEAMQNAAKHAQASRVDLRLASRDAVLTFAVTDDGRGFLASATPAGAGTQNMRDRLEALGGTLHVSSAPGAGTTVSGKVLAALRPVHPGVPSPRSGSPRRTAEG